MACGDFQPYFFLSTELSTVHAGSRVKVKGVRYSPKALTVVVRGLFSLLLVDTT